MPSAVCCGKSEAVILGRVLEGVRRPPSSVSALVPPAVDAVVLRALRPNPRERYADAGEMARALGHAMTPAPAADVGAWVIGLAGGELGERQEKVARVERGEKWIEARERLGSDATRTALPALAVDPPTVDKNTTTVALSTSTASVPVRRKGTRWWIAAAALLVGGAAGYAAFERGGTSAVAEHGGLARSAALPNDAPELEESSASIATTTIPTAPPAPRAPLVRPRVAKPAPPTAPNCNPPVERDKNGILRVKPGCAK
jgi:serine/threonine-protein kinase